MLYPQYLCDTLLTQATDGLFRPLWSQDVLDELAGALTKNADFLHPEQIEHRLNEMKRNFPDAEVTGYADLVPSMACDTKDRHVLAAAVRSNAEVLVTNNLRHFPDAATAPYDITVLSADDFLLDQLDLRPSLVLEALERQASRLTRPDMSVEQLLEALERCGVGGFVAEVRVQRAR